jgi:HSP20 family protein
VIIMFKTDCSRYNGLIDPWREFERLNRFLSGLTTSATSEFPAVNLWTETDGLVVTTEIPGIKPEDIDISIMDKSVTLRGSRKTEGPGEGESYHLRERWHGKFSKTIGLPFRINTDKAIAGFKKGVLTITLPKAESEKPRKIVIN